MEKNLEDVYRNVEDVKQDVRGIKETLAKQDRELKKTSNKLDEILTVLHTSPVTDFPSDAVSVSSCCSTSTEDETLKSTGYKTKCLASAIQSWFWEIIKKMPFDEINDAALQAKLITLEEHGRFRRPENKEDGKRMLLSNIMDKSCETMLSFVDIVGLQNQDLKKFILSTFDDRWKMEMNMFNEECTLCLIKRRCDITDLCDFYFTRELISKELLNDVVRSPLQERSRFWPRFYAEISRDNGGYAITLMKDYLSENDQFEFHSDITRHIDRDVKRGKRSFKCRCQMNMKRPSPMNVDLEGSPSSTSSMGSPGRSPARLIKRLRHSSLPLGYQLEITNK